MAKRTAFALLVALTAGGAVQAQEVEVDRYNVAARIDIAQSALDVRATVTVSNIADSSKSRLYFRLNKLAKVTSASVGGVPAEFETSDDRRVSTLNQIVVTPKTSLAAGATSPVEINYRIEVPESGALAYIYQAEVLLTPEAVWVPMPSTHFTPYGPTTAPFTLTVTGPPGVSGFRIASAGISKGEAGQTTTFEQQQNSIPILLAAAFDAPIAAEHGGVKLGIYVQPGLNSGDGEAGTQGQVARIIDETRHAIDYFTKTLGPLPSGVGFNIISSFRSANVVVPGALVLGQQVFRQEVLDVATIEVIADAVSRLWVDGRVRVRGREGRSGQRALTSGLLRDSLPRYLAVLYLEDRFGAGAAADAFARMRWTYTPIAQSRRDAELGIQTLLLPTYGAAMLCKGPLVLRLIAETAGRAKYLAALRSTLSGPQTKAVTFLDLKAAVVKDSNQAVDKLFGQWVEAIVEPDLIIGIPQPSGKPGVQRVNIRNLGDGDVTASVLGITAGGKKIQASVTVPSEDLTSVELATGEKLELVEVDPDKLIIQTNYDNDTRPVRLSRQSALNDGMVAFSKGEYAQAEATLRGALRTHPGDSLLNAWLARALVAQNKPDEASAAISAVLNANPPLLTALAWANMAQGQIEMSRGRAAEAVPPLRRALVEASDAPAQFAAREMLAKAETVAGKLPPVEQSIEAFLAQFDALIRQPSSDKLFAVVIRSNLKRFVQGLTVSPPTAWSSQIMRVERLDANRVAVDVGLKVTAEGRDQSGSAVFSLYRTTSGWMLEDVRLFNVK